jgi:hypothetical protein
MSKLKTFFRTFYRSLLDFDYYQDVLAAPFSFSLKYFFLLLLIGQFIMSVIFAISLAGYLPKTPQLIKDIKTTTNQFYPDELTITINDGKVKTNVDEPYYIDLPKKLQKESGLKHLLVIDTKAKIEDFAKYKVPVMLTSSSFVYIDKENSYKVSPLTDVKGYYLINKATYQEVLSRIYPYVDKLDLVIYFLIASTIFVWPLLAASFELSNYFFYLIFMALLIWLITILLKKNLGYKKAFQLGIHSLTLPLLVAFVVKLLNIQMPTFTFSAIFVLLNIVIVSRLPQTVKASV